MALLRQYGLPDMANVRPMTNDPRYGWARLKSATFRKIVGTNPVMPDHDDHGNNYVL